MLNAVLALSLIAGLNAQSSELTALACSEIRSIRLIRCESVGRDKSRDTAPHLEFTTSTCSEIRSIRLIRCESDERDESPETTPGLLVRWGIPVGVTLGVGAAIYTIYSVRGR